MPKLKPRSCAAKTPLSVDLSPQIVALAESTAGRLFTSLSPIEAQALVLVVLHRSGVIAPDCTIRPLHTWSTLVDGPPRR